MKPSPRLRLIEVRKHHQWSQQEVADRLGTTQHNVSRWERGATTPTAYFQTKLCELFGMQPRELDLLFEQTGEVEQGGSEQTPDQTQAIPSTPIVDQPSPHWLIPAGRTRFLSAKAPQAQRIAHHRH